MVPVLVLAFMLFGPVPVSAWYITGMGNIWRPYRYWHICTLVQYQYGHGPLPVLALNGASTSNVNYYHAKWHKIYASTSIVPPLLGAILNWEFARIGTLLFSIVLVMDMDPNKMPVRILIPIRVLAFPLPVMGMCTFWYQHMYPVKFWARGAEYVMAEYSILLLNDDPIDIGI